MREFVRFGIIGTGAISDVHVNALKSLDQCKLVGVVASTHQRSQEAAARFGVPGFSDVSMMLREVKPDALIVCTWSGHHLEPTLAAIDAGVHVLCEKPLEINTSRALQMLTAAKNSGVALSCIFQNRYAADFLRLKRAVSDGQLGDILFAHAGIKWYRDPAYYSSSKWKGTLAGDGGAALINQGIHTIDLLLNLLGEPKKVFAKTATLFHEIEAEDFGTAIVTFGSGAFATITGSTALQPGYPERLEVFGTAGSVILEAGKVVAWNVGEQEEAVKVSIGESGSADPLAIDQSLHRAQIQAFTDALRNDTTPEVSGTDSIAALNLIEHIYISAQQGREVNISTIKL